MVVYQNNQLEDQFNASGCNPFHRTVTVDFLSFNALHIHRVLSDLVTEFEETIPMKLIASHQLKSFSTIQSNPIMKHDI